MNIQGGCGGASFLGMSKTFSAGFRLGVALVLLVWVLWDCLVDDDMGKDVWHDPAFKVYRGLGNLVLLLLCWGVDVHVWRRAGIDYERFLRLPPTPPGSDPTVVGGGKQGNLSASSTSAPYNCPSVVIYAPDASRPYGTKVSISP